MKVAHLYRIEYKEIQLYKIMLTFMRINHKIKLWFDIIVGLVKGISIIFTNVLTISNIPIQINLT